jgi:hypothetical protein
MKTRVQLMKNYEDKMLSTHSVINQDRETYCTQKTPLVKTILRL